MMTRRAARSRAPSCWLIRRRTRPFPRTTDSSGQFQLQARASTYQLAAVRPGYKSVLSAPIRFQDGERLTVRIPIAENGDPQNKIGVMEHVDCRQVKTAESKGPDNDGGVASRKSAGIGLQYNHDDFDKTSFQSLGSFLQSVPGLRVADPRSASSMAMTRTGASMVNSALRRNSAMTVMSAGIWTATGWTCRAGPTR